MLQRYASRRGAVYRSVESIDPQASLSCVTAKVKLQREVQILDDRFHQYNSSRIKRSGDVAVASTIGYIVLESGRQEGAVMQVRDLMCRVLFVAGLLAAADAYGPAAHAQTLAGKQLHLVVPAAAGGGFDSFARLVARKVSENLKTPVIIENKGGAGHVIATAAVARAAPDGTTILLAGGNYTTNPIFNRKLTYDSLRDFEPVMVMAKTPFMVVANQALPFRNLQELIAYAKANPGKLNYTASQPNGASHLTGELLKLGSGIEMTFVPYQGSAPALTDVVAGRVQVMIDAPVTAMPQVEAGALRPLAVSSATRSAYLPNIPTLAESGFPQIDVTAWVGLLVPAGTSKENIRWLNEVFTQALTDAELQQPLAAQYWTVTPSSPEEMRTFVESEMKQWADLVARAKLLPN